MKQIRRKKAKGEMLKLFNLGDKMCFFPVTISTITEALTNYVTK